MKARGAPKAISLFVIVLNLAYVIFIWSFSYDFPNADDYTAILLPLIKYNVSDGFTNLITVIFEPHTQHLQVILRIVAFIVWRLLGTLNFRVLIAIGLLSLPILLYLIGKLSGSKHKALIYILTFFALAQPQYAEATLWATNAIPYLWINVFAALAIYSRIHLKSWWSLLWAALSTLSWGNGILVPLICSLIPNTCSRWLRASHLGLFLVFVLLQLNNPNTAGISRSLVEIPSILTYFLRLLGSAPGYYSESLSMYFGLAVVVSGALLVFKSRNKFYNSPLFLFAIFLLGSLLLCAITRVSEGAASAYTTSRYTLPSVLLILVLILIALEEFTEKKAFQVIAVCLCSFFWLYSNVSFTGMMQQRNELLSDSKFRWVLFKSGLAGTSWESLNQLHLQAEAAGIIPISNNFKELANKTEVPVSKLSGDAVLQVEYLLSSPSAFHISGYFVPLDSKLRGKQSYLLLKATDGARYAYALESRDRPDVVLHLGNVRPILSRIDERHAGFSVFANVSEVPAGRYSTYLIVPDVGNGDSLDHSSVRFDLQRTITIIR